MHPDLLVRCEGNAQACTCRVDVDLSKKQSGREIVTYFTTDGCRTFLHWIGCIEQSCKKPLALGQAHAIRPLIQHKDNEHQGS